MSESDEVILNRILFELQHISRQLAAGQAIATSRALKHLNRELLTTPKRRQMYNLFDGKHSMQDVAKKLKVSSEAVRLLVDELEGIGAVIISKKVGKTKFPQKLI